MSEEIRVNEGLEGMDAQSEEMESRDMVEESYDEYDYDDSAFEDDGQDETPEDEMQCPVIGHVDWEDERLAPSDVMDEDDDAGAPGKTLAFPFGMMQAMMDSEPEHRFSSRFDDEEDEA